MADQSETPTAGQDDQMRLAQMEIEMKAHDVQISVRELCLLSPDDMPPDAVIMLVAALSDLITWIDYQPPSESSEKIDTDNPF